MTTDQITFWSLIVSALSALASAIAAYYASKSSTAAAKTNDLTQKLYRDELRHKYCSELWKDTIECQKPILDIFNHFPDKEIIQSNLSLLPDILGRMNESIYLNASGNLFSLTEKTQIRRFLEFSYEFYDFCSTQTLTKEIMGEKDREFNEIVTRLISILRQYS